MVKVVYSFQMNWETLPKLSFCICFKLKSRLWENSKKLTTSGKYLIPHHELFQLRKFNWWKRTRLKFMRTKQGLHSNNEKMLKKLPPQSIRFISNLLNDRLGLLHFCEEQKFVQIILIPKWYGICPHIDHLTCSQLSLSSSKNSICRGPNQCFSTPN